MPFKSDYLVALPCLSLLKELLDGITELEADGFARGVLQIPAAMMSTEEYFLYHFKNRGDLGELQDTNPFILKSGVRFPVSKCNLDILLEVSTKF